MKGKENHFWNNTGGTIGHNFMHRDMKCGKPGNPFFLSFFNQTCFNTESISQTFKSIQERPYFRV